MIVDPYCIRYELTHDKSPEELLKEIRTLRRRIHGLEYMVMYGMPICEFNCWIEDYDYICYEGQLKSAREEISWVREKYLELEGNSPESYSKIFTPAELKAMKQGVEFEDNLNRLFRITYTQTNEDPEGKVCQEYVADFSVEPFVTFKKESRSDSKITMKDEFFQYCLDEQKKVSGLPADQQMPRLQQLRDTMMQLRDCRVINMSDESEEPLTMDALLENFDIETGGWKKDYTVKDLEKERLRRISCIKRSMREWDLTGKDFYPTIDDLDNYQIPDIGRKWSLMIEYRDDDINLSKDDEDIAEERKPLVPLEYKGTINQPPELVEFLSMFCLDW